MVMSASGRRGAVSALSRLGAFPGVQLVLFCIGSLLLFYRNLGRTFAADDFEVIRRVVVERRFLIPGFFRPLSDVSLYANFLIGGLHPAVYYLFNILVHGVNCFLLYRFCKLGRAPKAEGRKSAGRPRQRGADGPRGRGASRHKSD